MKVKVISVFRDKETDKIIPLNEELTISNKRYEEIKEYVEIIKTSIKDDNQEAED